MKRGISPLIATVLLIGTTIMIAALVSTFIINQTKKFEPEKFMGESSYCQDVVLGTKVLVDDASMCSELQDAPESWPDECFIISNMALVNKGTFTIYGYDISSVGIGSGYASLEETPLLPGKSMCRVDQGGVCDVDRLFKPGICPGKTVRIVPHIKVEGKEITCTQSEMIIAYPC